MRTRSALLGLLLATIVNAVDSVPYGHPDFVPTPERPIGYQGDGNGHFPGATLVSEFWEGRPVVNTGKVEMIFGKAPTLVYGDQVPKNILWKTELPGWTYAQPIPVKGRVYGIAEPDWVWCADQQTGQILWQERLTIASCDPALAGKPEEQKKRQEIYDIGKAAIFLDVPYRTVEKVKPPTPRWPNLTPNHPYVAQNIAILEKMKARLQELDPELVPACDQQIAAVKTFQQGGLDAVLKAIEAKQPALDIGPEVTPVLYRAINKKYKVSLRPTWMGWTPYAVSVAASDGERIFVCLGSGQVGAFDLDGKRLWSDLQTNSGLMRMVDHWPSPVVVGDKVIMRNLSVGGKNCGLIAYDTATGKKVWERGGFQGGGHGILVTPLQVTVNKPGGRTQNLISWCEQVLDAADGSVLAADLKDPNGKKYNETQGQVGRDGHWTLGGAERTSVRYGVAWQDGKATPLHDFIWDGWQGPYASAPKNPDMAALTPLLLADAPVLFANGTAWDWNTGRILGKFARRNDGGQGGPRSIGDVDTALTLIGRTILGWTAGEGGSTTGRIRKDRLAAGAFKTADISDPRNPRMGSAWNLIGGAEPPSDVVFSTWLSGVDMFDFWLMHTGHNGWIGGGAFTGLPTWLGGGQCGSLAHGERTFIQTYKYLYCVGPAVKGTATDDPKVVAAIRAGQEVEKHLTSNSAQYRLEAVQQMKTASDAVRRLAVADPYEEIRAAAIQVLEKAQAGAGKTLVKERALAFAQTPYKWMAIDGLMDSFALAQTCKRLGELADAPLAEAIAGIEPKYRVRLLVMIEQTGICGPQVEKACLGVMTAAKVKPNEPDLAALTAATILARAGKAAAHAEAMLSVIEGHLVAWDDGMNDDSGAQPWVAVDACLALPAQRARVLTVLGRKLEAGPKQNADPINPALRRIEATGKDAAALAPVLTAFKEKQKDYGLWVDRILAGMK
jgi:hypothetical protein